MGSIYCLYSTQDGIPRYVGKATINPEGALKKLIADALDLSEKSPLYDWMREVFRSGHIVEAYELQKEISKGELEIFENYWAEKFSGLLNAGTKSRSKRTSKVAAQVTEAIKSRLAARRSSS